MTKRREQDQRAVATWDGRSAFSLAFVLLAAGAWLSGAAMAEGELALVRDGKALATIVHNGHEEQAVALSDYLARITGATFESIPESAPGETRRQIVLQTVERVKGASDRPTAEHAYRLRTDGNRLWLTGASEEALTYAVYGFLEDHLGVRLYSPEFEVVPKRPSLSLAALDDLQEPAFRHRSFNWTMDRSAYPTSGSTSSQASWPCTRPATNSAG